MMIAVTDCIPSKFWLLSRHGTRLPGKKDIELLPQALNNVGFGVLINFDEREDIEQCTLISASKFDSGQL